MFPVRSASVVKLSGNPLRSLADFANRQSPHVLTRRPVFWTCSPAHYADDLREPGRMMAVHARP